MAARAGTVFGAQLRRLACMTVGALLDARAGVRIVTVQTLRMTGLTAGVGGLGLFLMAARALDGPRIATMGQALVAALAAGVPHVAGELLHTLGMTALATTEIEPRSQRGLCKGERMGSMALGTHDSFHVGTDIALRDRRVAARAVGRPNLTFGWMGCMATRAGVNGTDTLVMAERNVAMAIQAHVLVAHRAHRVGFMATCAVRMACTCKSMLIRVTGLAGRDLRFAETVRSMTPRAGVPACIGSFRYGRLCAGRVAVTTTRKRDLGRGVRTMAIEALGRITDCVLRVLHVHAVALLAAQRRDTVVVHIVTLGACLVGMQLNRRLAALGTRMATQTVRRALLWVGTKTMAAHAI